MYILITYDVNTTSENGAQRLRKVARICQDYGQRVQNSVFECLITPTQLVQITSLLLHAIDKEHDSLRIYHLGGNYKDKITTLGRQRAIDMEGEILL